MADKDTDKREKVVEPEVIRPTEATVVKRRAPWPFITIGIVAVVVVVALFIASVWFIASRNNDRTGMRSGVMNERGMANSSGRYGENGGTYNGRRGSIAPAASGVITAIDGDTITVSGNGKQVTVKKTSSTVISGSKTDIAVNDTVSVTGDTASDGSVTATRIMIRNQTTSGATIDDNSMPPSSPDVNQVPSA